MADLTYPTDLDLGAPWLVTEEQLEALDEIVERETIDLKASAELRLYKDVNDEIANIYRNRSDEVKEKIRQELRSARKEYRGYSIDKRIQMSLRGGKRLSASTFKEASAHPEVADSRIEALEMEFGNGETRCSLSIGGRWSKNLRLSVSGANQQDRERLFFALRNWVSDCQAPVWQRVWCRLASSGIQWVLWWGALVSSLIIVTAGNGHSPYVDAAHKLLAKGLDSKDLTKALEVILALQSGYQPKADPTVTPLWFWLVVFGGPLACIALSIHPRVEIGLGKGTARLRFWKWWTRLVAVTLPIFLLSTVAKDIITNIIGKI